MRAGSQITALLFLLTGSVFFADASAAGQIDTVSDSARTVPSPSHIAAAMDVLKISNAQQNTMMMVELVSTPVLNIVRASNPNISEPVLTEFKTQFDQELKSELPGLMKSQAELYAMHFSEAELRKLTEFYRTPLGHKMLAETPAIMKEGAAIGQVWGRQAGRNAMLKVLARMRKNGLKI